jgi:hypothetical protein
MQSMSLTEEVLRKYPGNVFVETGTNIGDGVALALECGFKDVRSIEVEQYFYLMSQRRFEGDKRVSLYYGDSAIWLGRMIVDITEPIVFWLDGHIHPGYTVGLKDIPLIEELDLIAQHPIKNHTILVDDRRMMGTAVWHCLGEEIVIESLMKINPNYTISYEDNLNDTRDVIVARVA